MISWLVNGLDKNSFKNRTKTQYYMTADLYTYELRIPKERIAVLIGKKGEIKKYIMGEINVSLEVDSHEGDVFIRGNNALGLFNAREIVKAIGRGFNPDIAFQLMKPEYMFESVNVSDYAGSKVNEARLKGRVIGKEGKARLHFEELTETAIVIYGKTISLVGKAEQVIIAKKAIESLLQGSRHATVYKWLEQCRKKRNKVAEEFHQDER